MPTTKTASGTQHKQKLKVPVSSANLKLQTRYICCCVPGHILHSANTSAIVVGRGKRKGRSTNHSKPTTDRTLSQEEISSGLGHTGEAGDGVDGRLMLLLHPPVSNATVVLATDT